MAFAESRVQHLLPQRTAFGVALRLSAALITGAFLLGLLFTWAAPTRVAEACRGLRPAWLLLGFAAVLPAYGLRACRWALLLRRAGAEVRFRDAAVPIMGAAAVDNLLPLEAGEAIRQIALQSFAERPGARLLGTIALDKRLDLAAACAVLLASLLAWPPTTSAQRLGSPAGVLAIALVAVSAWTAIAAPRPARDGESAAAGTPPAGGAATGEGGRGRARLALQVCALSLAACLADAVVFFAAGQALGLAAAAPAAGLAAGLLGAARRLPALPAHLGLFDFFAAAAAVVFGAPPALAVAYAILSHALFWAPATATGWCLLVGAARIGVTRGPLIAA
jgi:uncharacterized membrane protein YbhN (UPF0104 family)